MASSVVADESEYLKKLEERKQLGTSGEMELLIQEYALPMEKVKDVQMLMDNGETAGVILEKLEGSLTQKDEMKASVVFRQTDHSTIAVQPVKYYHDAYGKLEAYKKEEVEIISSIHKGEETSYDSVTGAAKVRKANVIGNVNHMLSYLDPTCAGLDALEHYMQEVKMSPKLDADTLTVAISGKMLDEVKFSAELAIKNHEPQTLFVKYLSPDGEKVQSVQGNYNYDYTAVEGSTLRYPGKVVIIQLPLEGGMYEPKVMVYTIKSWKIREVKEGELQAKLPEGAKVEKR